MALACAPGAERSSAALPPTAPVQPATSPPPPASAPTAQSTEEREMNTVDLSWGLTREGDHLRVSYTLHNGGDAGLLVLDQMIVFGQTDGYDRAPDAIIARADDQDPTLLHLVRGRVQPYGRAMIELVPGGRDLAPGAELSGAALVPLPLRGWHPNDRFRDLATPPTRAVLEIGVLPADAPTDDWPVPGGSLRVPSPPAPQTAQVLVRGEVLTLP